MECGSSHPYARALTADSSFTIYLAHDSHALQRVKTSFCCASRSVPGLAFILEPGRPHHRQCCRFFVVAATDILFLAISSAAPAQCLRSFPFFATVITTEKQLNAAVYPRTVIIAMLKSLLPSAPALYTIFLLLPPALCHMEMSWPYPLRSKFNPETPESMIDYSMTSPLEASGSNYPCKGYQNDADKPISITYTAGSTYNMSLAGTATHGGGSCQLSLSYDNGQSFKVIKSMIGGCPLTDTYDFTIPASAPSGDALFAWTWQNKLGNREFYMNCAAVNIQSGSSSRRYASQ